MNFLDPFKKQLSKSLYSWTKSYQYNPLSSETADIRILYLEPGLWNSEIQCNLIHVSLNDKPEYEALSYTWGNTEEGRWISLGGFRRKVTANLEIALRYLRSETQRRALWVDAICINQADLQEKADQIPKMRRIYASAAAVLAWTGESSHDSDAAIALMRELSEFSPNFDSADVARGITSEGLQHMGFDPATKNWLALWNFWERSYWTRIWVVQELAGCDMFRREGQTRCFIGCGRTWIPKVIYDESWTLLLAILKSGASYSGSIKEIKEPLLTALQRGTPPALTMGTVLLQFNPTAPHMDSLNISHLIRATKRFQATDSRDRIYALLGLSREIDRAFEIDYTKSSKAVWKDFIRFAIKTDQNLRCLEGNRESCDCITPSWIPVLNDKLEMGVSWGNDNRVYNASANLLAAVECIDERDILICKGVRIGVLDNVIGPITSIQSQSRIGVQFHDMETLLDASGNRVPYKDLFNFRLTLSEEKQEVFWRTLVMDQDSRDWDTLLYPAPAAFDQQHRVLFGSDTLPEDYEPQLPPDVRFAKFVDGFQFNFENGIIDRCFWSTEDGQMGLGPKGARRGDVVAVLFGGNFPFVLRPRNQHYQLVGNAYVQGAMGGEYVKQYVDDSTLEGEEFSLC
jgi:hypothetical protein